MLVVHTMEPKVRQFSPLELEKQTMDQPDGSTGAGEVTNALAPRTTLERIPTYLQPPISLRERLRHFTFAWYTVT